MSDSKPKITSEEELYNGRIFNVTKATVDHDGMTYQRELVKHIGSAVVLPIHSNGDITLVRQFRIPADDYLFEVPAGTVERGESPDVCAHREIEEETGYVADELKKICEFYVSPGFLNEKMHLFFATSLRKTVQNLDDDEVLSAVRMSRNDAFDLLDKGSIVDAKTIIALLNLRYRV